MPAININNNTKTDWVIDTSFTMPLFLADEYSDAIDGFFNVALQKNVTIFVPAVWWFEISNALHTGVKRKRLNYQQALHAIEICQGFNFFQIEPIVFNQTLFDLCQAHHLTSYDASYLDLALRYQAGLASLDKELNTVAQQLGIETWE